MKRFFFFLFSLLLLFCPAASVLLVVVLKPHFQRVEMREQLLQVSSRRIQHVSIFFCYSPQTFHFIPIFRRFLYIFLCMCHIAFRISIVFGCPVAVALKREKKIAENISQVYICHVLYPVNWRFSIVIKQFFKNLFRCLHGFGYCCFFFFISLFLACQRVPYEISSLT